MRLTIAKININNSTPKKQIILRSTDSEHSDKTTAKGNKNINEASKIKNMIA